MADGPPVANQRRPWGWPGWTLFAAGLVVTAAGLTWALAVIPRWLYPPLPAIELGQVSDPDRRIELETNRLRLQNDARTTMLQGLAGLAVLGGAIVATQQLRLGRDQLQHNLKASHQQLELSRSGQLTERFTRAIDQLGTEDQLEVVLGGIYALERIAHDSGEDRPIIGEILAAYVRTHAPWPPRHKAEATLNQLHRLQTRAPNVQAALTVLGRGKFGTELDLRRTDLRKADLRNAKFKGARLYDAALQGARLRDADLQGARLDRAILQGARLDDAVLQGARLHDADLQGARLNGANFQEAQFDRATLRGALADGTTKWPDGFDPSAAGVLPSEGANADRRP
jgi:hypothetical protein